MISDENNSKKCRVFLSAAETSGDRLCAKLISVLKQKNPDIEFVGLGGENMARAGCEIIVNTTQKAAMHYKALLKIFFFLKVFKKARRYFENNKVDLVIVCDSPAFNFHIAKAAAKSNVKTMFYVAPQLWAWAPWRIRKLKRLCTAPLAALLPFEPEWFGSRGVDCRFVGNPLLEEIETSKIKPKDYRGFSIASAHIALMPGSRPAEIKTLWPAMQQMARRLKARHPGIKFTAVAADENVLKTLKKTELKILRCNYATDAVFDTAKKVDLALVASGSATLQVAAAACPMAIVYQSNKFLWETIGKRLVKIPHLSLVNILAGKGLVPEFMPYFTSVSPIVEACEKLLNDTEAMKKLSTELNTLLQPFNNTNAAEAVADMAISAISETNK